MLKPIFYQFNILDSFVFYCFNCSAPIFLISNVIGTLGMHVWWWWWTAKLLATHQTKKLTVLNWGQTDRFSLTLDRNPSPWPSMPCEPWSSTTHLQSVKVKSESVQKIRVDTNGEMDWGIALPPVLMRPVITSFIHIHRYICFTNYYNILLY